MSTDHRAKALRALTQMGFRESEAKQALDEVPTRAALTLDALLREALRELVPTIRRPLSRCP